MDRQPAAVIIDKAELSEPIHEMTGPRPRGAREVTDEAASPQGQPGPNIMLGTCHRCERQISRDRRSFRHSETRPSVRLN